MDIGERWGYRARGIDPLVEIEVLKRGTQKPARVLVRFIDVTFEGREEWVPPARLKALWPDVPEFEARAARWEAVDTHPGLREAPEEYAIDAVLREVIGATLAEPSYRQPGVTFISDVGGLARRLQLDEAVLRAEPVSFEEDGQLVVPWATTELIVRRICELEADAVMRYVDKEEEEARHEALHGRRYSNSRGTLDWYVTAKEAAVADAERPYGRPTREVLRAWCGMAAVERQDELNALREEVARIDGLLSEAIRAMRARGQKVQADDLERRFGVSVPEARGSRG